MKNLFKKITLNLICCFAFVSISAQSLDNLGLDGLQSRMVVNGDRTKDSNTKGSQYIDDNFTTVRINRYKDKIFSGRYNAFNNELEVLVEDDNLVVLNPASDYEVVFINTNKIYRGLSYTTEDGVSKTSFLVVLSENEKYTLFKEERVKFYEKVESKSSYDKEKPAEYKRISDNYYIKLGDNVTFLPQNKKDLLKAFPDESKKLTAYMKDKKLNPKNEDDLIVLAEYLSTLNK